MSQSKSTMKDMTVGSPMSLILGFSIPLLLGILFQQFYNMVDSIIVGRCIGVDALAAVGATGSVNFLIIGFCIGVCSGFSIPIAQRFGAGDEKGVRQYIAGSVWLSVGFSIVITIIVTLLCSSILKTMRTPENIFSQSYSYIHIIFLGIPVVFLYNMAAGIMRSLGDSKTPVYFLVLSSVMNIFLDLIFIRILGFGVEGAAYATVISQGTSGILCLFYMIRKFPILHLSKSEWKPVGKDIWILCNMGIPMGLQYSITAIGSVILQSAVNGLGSGCVAAVTTSAKISIFTAAPMDALGSTMATFGGQNVGAKKLDRVKEGLRDAVILSTIYSVILFIVIYFTRKYLVLLFLDPSETVIIAQASLYLMVQIAFFFFLGLVNIVRFLIQGMGFPKFAILAGVCEMVARTFVGFVLVPKYGFNAASLASPIAWIMADAFLIPAYFYVNNKLQKLFTKSDSIAN